MYDLGPFYRIIMGSIYTRFIYTCGVQVYVRKPEVDSGCRPQSLSAYFLWQDLSLNLEFNDPAGFDALRTPVFLLPPPHQCWHERCLRLQPVPRIQTQVLVGARQERSSKMCSVVMETKRGGWEYQLLLQDTQAWFPATTLSGSQLPVATDPRDPALFWPP